MTEQTQQTSKEAKTPNEFYKFTPAILAQEYAEKYTMSGDPNDKQMANATLKHMLINTLGGDRDSYALVEKSYGHITDEATNSAAGLYRAIADGFMKRATMKDLFEGHCGEGRVFAESEAKDDIEKKFSEVGMDKTYQGIIEAYQDDLRVVESKTGLFSKEQQNEAAQRIEGFEKFSKEYQMIMDIAKRNEMTGILEMADQNMLEQILIKNDERRILN